MIGSELGGRYEIITRIGGGGMALVYKAYDTVLQRNVAVKVLRDQFVHDEEFIQRFRREARSAASLSHPNVVSIYDVGQDQDTHYIVMEYIEGGTLNDIIKERAPLQPEEAVKIAGQICDALDHAHHNGIIHRDIKPHNILINRNGRVKVTDFGIARAATSSDITQTGAVLGSVHYFSPEHAKGVAQGEKSDIYSLGAVLYQMLTNRLPFPGESPISVALKHLQEDFERPRGINPLIPQSLENIILKAMRKDPEQRYDSAKSMLKDLDTCLQPDRVGEAAIYDSEDDDAEKTIIMPAIREHREYQPDEHAAQTQGRIAESLEEKPIRRKWWIKPVVWLVIVLALFLGTWQGVKAVWNKMEVPDVRVPSVVGWPYEDAVAELEQLKLEVQLTEDQYSEEYEEGLVIWQSKSDIQVKENSLIQLTVSMGPERYEMPDLLTMTEDEARNTLIELGVSTDRIEVHESFDDDQPPGEVMGQDPEPGEMINPREDRISITISQGPGTVDMPDVVGDTLEVARTKLQRDDLDENLKIVTEPDYSQPKDHVFRQWPYEPGDKVSPGAEITLYVSAGLPSDAVQYEKLVNVEPAEEGIVSSIQILISDASGENKDWGTREIMAPTGYRVGVVVSPQSKAILEILRDGVHIDTITVTYAEARSGGSGQSGTRGTPQQSDADNDGWNESSEGSGSPEGSEDEVAVNGESD